MVMANVTTKGNKDEEKHLIHPSLHANEMSVKCIRVPSREPPSLDVLRLSGLPPAKSAKHTALCSRSEMQNKQPQCLFYPFIRVSLSRIDW